MCAARLRANPPVTTAHVHGVASDMTLHLCEPDSAGWTVSHGTSSGPLSDRLSRSTGDRDHFCYGGWAAPAVLRNGPPAKEFGPIRARAMSGPRNVTDRRPGTLRDQGPGRERATDDSDEPSRSTHLISGRPFFANLCINYCAEVRAKVLTGSLFPRRKELDRYCGTICPHM